ncbi:MAG: protein-L-isoaspartate(D-aspartate) O-methyltransferase [Planctomycetota bacterium]|jgi:protein-L-isoaspartate(D-aspartate) O-methyltransferase
MARQEEHLAADRQVMLQRHLRGRRISDERVLAAFAAVPRERFVLPESYGEAYDDHPLPIGFGQTISQPYIVAEMVQQLHCKPHHRVLDIGSGSGYQTAILAYLVDHVYAVEKIEPLLERSRSVLADLDITNVALSAHDGTLGWAEHAPFDGIISGAAAPHVPTAWMSQLADGGRIVAPVGGGYAQDLIVAERQGDRWHEELVCGVRFVKLIGEDGWPDN